MLYAVYGFVCGLGIGVVLYLKHLSDTRTEMERIFKSHRNELGAKDEIIASLRKQIERRT